MPKYQFIERVESPYKQIIYNNYYQLCYFPEKGKYNIRKYTFDNNFNITDIKYYLLTDLQKRQFVNSHNIKQYRVYPTYNLDNVAHPVQSDLAVCLSELI